MSLLPVCLDKMTVKKDKDEVPEQKKKQDREFAVQAVGMATTISVEIAVTTVAGYFCGHFLDGKFDTGPWLMLVGVLLGLAVGFMFVYKTLQVFFKERK
ncbi:MAG: AtpZ/AtpI family protein [Desulfotomaculaceae bacterium]|nr:AtpZ/AtpI family protein [Desulfotomaculaceae bacterium]